MNRNEKEAKLRIIEGKFKILEIRARFSKEENANKYHEIVRKLSCIRENRHLAMVGEKNEEGKIYEKLLDIIGENYEDNDEMKIYKAVVEVLKNYKLREKNRDINDIGEER